MTAIWQSDVTVWMHALTVSPTPRAFLNAGVAVTQQGDMWQGRHLFLEVPASDVLTYQAARINMATIDQWARAHR